MRIVASLLPTIPGQIDLGAINIWIGFGLLRRNPTSRRWAVGLTIVELTISAIAILTLPFSPAAIPISILKVPVGIVSKYVVMAAVTIFGALAIWQYRVLTRADVRALFDDQASQSTALHSHSA